MVGYNSSGRNVSRQNGTIDAMGVDEWKVDEEGIDLPLYTIRQV